MNRIIKSQFEESLFTQSTIQTSRGALLAVMNVEIHPGQKDKIFIHELDNQFELAQSFVLKHKLPAKALMVLQKQIEGNKQAVRQSTLPRPPDSTPVSSRQKQQERKESFQPTLKKQAQQLSMSRYSRMSRSNVKSNNMSRSRSTTDITNRLYNENLMKSKYLYQLQQKALMKLQKIQTEATSHTPQINGISNALASERRKQNRIQDHLFQLGNLQTLKKQRAASLKVIKELQQCSFKPLLNKMTNKLTLCRAEPTFDKALEKNMQIANPNSFSPALNKLSRQIMQNKAPFIARQKQYQQLRQFKISKMYKEKKKNQTLDPSTGKPFFKPSNSGKHPKIWNQNDLDIGEYLYDKGRVKPQQVLPEPKVSINRYSEQLVRNMHTKRIVWLFGQLDSDQDGLISSQKISIESIPDDILQIIMPILFQMQEFNFQLNLQQFTQALQSLHRSLNTSQKGVLYDYKRRKP